MPFQNKQCFPIVLLHEDPLILSDLKELIESAHYKAITTENWNEAHKILKNYSVAMVISDQFISQRKGLDILKEVEKIQPDAMRIIIAEYHAMESILEAINTGQIHQFILKSWDKFYFMQTIANAMDKYFMVQENRELHALIFEQQQALAKNRESSRQQLQLGSRIYETLLLGKSPPLIPGFTIKTFAIPSHKMDGNFFEFYHPVSQVLDVVIGDVMGKGIPAALVGTALKAQFNRFAIPLAHSQTIKNHGFWENDLFTPHEILSCVHQEFMSSLVHLEYFASLFYGRFNLQKHTLTYVDCGFTQPIHYRAKDKKAILLSGNHFPLGSIYENHYQSEETSYAPGDFFIFYSDGLIETMSPSHELYGLNRLTTLVENHSEADPETLIHRIKLSLNTFSKKETFEKDITIIIIKIEHFEVPILAGNVAKFLSNVSQLNEIRQFIERFTQQAPGDTEKLTIQLQIAINELFCNIVHHGYKDQKGIIILEIKLEAEGIWIEIADQGRVFDPHKIEEPSFVADKENGFGWYIVKTIADQVTYRPKQSKEGWNHIHIYKKYIEKGKKMHIAHSTINNILIITPEGDSLDATNAYEFKEKAIDLISTINLNNVVLDLSHINFIDSSGLGVFLSILRILSSKQGELKLACLSKTVRTICELVSMHKIFEIYHSIDEAIHSFKNEKQNIDS